MELERGTRRRIADVAGVIAVGLVAIAGVACEGSSAGLSVPPRGSGSGGTSARSVEDSATFEYTAGTRRGAGQGADCHVGPAESFLQLAQRPEEPTISVGRTPETPSGATSIAGGGTFTGDDVEIRFYFRPDMFDRVSNATVELAPDLLSGTFGGSLGGDALTGSFDCADPTPTPLVAQDVAHATLEDAFGSRIDVTVERLLLQEQLLDRWTLRLLVTYRLIERNASVFFRQDDWEVVAGGEAVRAQSFAQESPGLGSGSLEAGDTVTGWVEFDLPTGEGIEVSFTLDQEPAFTIHVDADGGQPRTDYAEGDAPN